MSYRISLLVVIMSLLVACGGRDSPQNTPVRPTDIPMPLLTDTPTPTVTTVVSQPTASAIPSPSTPGATVTPTSIPTSTPPMEGAAQYIFRLEISNCHNTSQREQIRAQTGFRLADRPGIITALHGVVGCSSIIASSDFGIIYQNLEIGEVDLDRDLTVLMSKELEDLPLTGLVVSEQDSLIPSCGTSEQQQMLVMGYPKSSLSIRKNAGFINCIRPLSDTVGNWRLKNALQKRSSPKLDISILDVDLITVHGHSGAPIVQSIDGIDYIVGVIIGGLPDTAPNGWGIPWVSTSRPTFVEHGIVANELAQLENLGIPEIPELMTFFALEGEPQVHLDPTPIPAHDFIDMQENQVWEGSFSVEAMQISQTACIAVYDKAYHVPDKLMLADTLFDPGDYRQQQVTLRKNVPLPLRPRYRAFCEMAEEVSSLTLYAYLLEWREGECRYPISIQGGKEVDDIFTLNTDTDIRNRGFCADRNVWP